MERKTVWFIAGLLIGALLGMVVCAWLDAMLHAVEASLITGRPLLSGEHTKLPTAAPIRPST